MFFKNQAKDKYDKIIQGLNLDDTQKLLLKVTWLDYLCMLDIIAWRGHKMHNILQLGVVFLSLIIPIIQGTVYKSSSLYGISWISIISLMIAMMTAINNQLRYEEKWSHSRKNAEMVRNEGEDFFALTGDYRNSSDHKIALTFFIAKITMFKRQEVNTYLESSRGKTNSSTNFEQRGNNARK